MSAPFSELSRIWPPHGPVLVDDRLYAAIDFKPTELHDPSGHAGANPFALDGALHEVPDDEADLHLPAPFYIPPI